MKKCCLLFTQRIPILNIVPILKNIFHLILAQQYLKLQNPRYTIPKITNNQLENFYNNFRNVAEYLNIDLLMKAIRFYPFWKQIINHLNVQKEYRLNNKLYFIYKGILIC